MRGFHVLLGFGLSLTLAGAAFAGDAPQPFDVEELAASADALENGKCEITCFKHSCSIECGPGKEPSCVCRNVETPGGRQWLPFCKCQKTQNAAEQTEDAGRANISKSQGWVTLYKGSEAKCKSIKCTGGSADSGETIGIEVEVDDTFEGTLEKGQESEFQGKKIRIRALSRMASYNLTNC